MSKKYTEPNLIPGGLAVDDRGQVTFINDFTFDGIKRFYMVSNHNAGFVRAWHAHKKEAKYVLVVRGAAVVGAVEIDDWKNPSNKTEVKRFVLSEKTPKILYIPEGYANGFKTMTSNTQVMFFSTSTLEESKDDDYRFDSRYWDIWAIEER